MYTLDIHLQPVIGHGCLEQQMQAVLLVGEQVAELIHLALQDRDLPRGFDKQSVVFVNVLLEKEVRGVDQFLHL